MECFKTGLISGTSATTFSPMQTMIRAMVVTILWRMEGSPKTTFNNKFKDVSSSQWYAQAISWAVNNGVVNGYGDGTFKPDGAVTREQVAVMLANYATFKNIYIPGTKKLNTYPDGSQVSTWAQAGMKWAISNGIISGNGEGYLSPKKSATRAEGAAMLLRIKNWLAIEGSGNCGYTDSSQAIPDNVTWTLYKNGILVISGKGRMRQYYNNGSPVATPWGTKAKTVIVSSGVTSIGDYAFNNCTGLTNAIIQKGVTTIGGNAFKGCSNLTSINLSNSVTAIGGYAFSQCTSLADITIPNSVTSIGDKAFLNCSELKTVKLSQNLTTVGQNIFEGTPYIDSLTGDCIILGNNILYSYKGQETNLTIPNTVCNIAGGAFKGCSKLASVVIPDSVTNIGDSAFYGCSGLTSITIPTSVKNIGEYAFYNCSSLTSVTIPDGVKSIGDCTFYGCTKLTSITIPASVTSIGKYAFYNCTSLTGITIPAGVTSIGECTFYGCSDLSRISIPAGVTSIGGYAFYKCAKLTNITLPTNVTSIGDCAFYGCSKLTTLSIPASVTSIGEYAFYNCSSLALSTIPAGVTSIRDCTFYGCSNLIRITIPASVTSIGKQAFYGCSSLADVYYRGTEKEWKEKNLYTFGSQVTIHYVN